MSSAMDQRTPAQKEIDRRVRQKVIQGMTLLQETFGDKWMDELDLEVLDLSNGESCVLGQVYPGHYDEGLRKLWGANSYGSDRPSAEHGFLLDSELAYDIDWVRYGYAVQKDEDGELWDDEGDVIGEEDLYYKMLTDAWIQEIQAARA